MKLILRLIFSFLLSIKISFKINNLLYSHGEDLIFLKDTKENYRKMLSAIGNKKLLLEKYKFSKQAYRSKLPNFSHFFLFKVFSKNFKKVSLLHSIMKFIYTKLFLKL